MGTRSSIAMKTVDGIKAIYCHWDGYVDHNGRILRENYSTEAQVTELINLGDLSSLGTKIGDVHPFDAKFGDEPELPICDDWCKAYHRDRGEDWAQVAPQTWTQDVKEWVKDMGQSGCEYFYLFNGQDWLVHKVGDVDVYDFPVFDFVEVEILKEIVS